MNPSGGNKNPALDSGGGGGGGLLVVVVVVVVVFEEDVDAEDVEGDTVVADEPPLLEESTDEDAGIELGVNEPELESDKEFVLDDISGRAIEEEDEDDRAFVVLNKLLCIL